MKRITIIVLFLFLGMHFAFAQGGTVTGTVTSAADGTTIPGVQVIVKGTTIGVTTNINGVYSIEVPASGTVLEFSFVGLIKQEIPINGRTTIDVVMKEDLFLLGEVIVVGYGTKGKNEITGSTVQVSGEELAEIPVTSVDQALQGKVAGLVISTASGTPGSIQDIRIRGVGSITAGNEPLFVIDGVPVVNNNFSGSGARSSLSALASLNSSDIETLTVLKDASATSAYGARGSNGVIVITTKRGKSGKTQFNFSTTYGFQDEATEGKLPLTGAHREELMMDALYNTYGASQGFTRDGAMAYYMANQSRDGGQLADWIAAGRPEANWKDITDNKNAPVMNISLSASGGDDVQSFYASFSYNKTEATVVNSVFERLTGVLNYNRMFRDNLKFSQNVNVSNTHHNGFLETSAYFANPRAGAFFFSPWIQPYTPDGEINLDTGGGNYNYLYLAEHDDTYNDLTRAISSTVIEWDIIEDLKFTSRTNIDYNLAYYKNFQNAEYGDSQPENGTSYASAERNINYVFQNGLDYNYIYKDNHRFSFKALMEFQKNKSHWLWGYGENFPTPGLTNIDNASANYDAGSSYDDWMNLSYLGMVNYNYLGKYIADFTYRREGSSRFAPDLRFGNFWSAGAAWNMSQENFLADVDWITNLRMRGSYGISGSSAIGLNSYQSLLSYDANYDDNGAVYPSGFGNSFLTWEKNKNYDVGIDFGFLDNKVSGSFAYYHKKTYDLLQNVPLSRTTGFTSVTKNIGAMINKGFEFIVNVDIIRSNDLNVNASFNFGTVDNEVTELAFDGNGEEIEINNGTRRVATGHALNEWYLRKWAGVDPATGEPEWYLNGTDGATTKNRAEAADTWQGKSPIPTYTGGVNFHVDYKGFFLDANAAFQGGNAIYESWGFYTHHAGRYVVDYYNGVELLMDRWQNPGDITDVPKMVWENTAFNSSSSSTRFLFDGDYIRLKDLVFGYDFPESIISKMKLNGLRAYVRGTNLFTWVKDKDLKYDPEVRADGFTGLETPPIKSIVFGLNVKF